MAFHDARAAMPLRFLIRLFGVLLSFLLRQKAVLLPMPGFSLEEM